MAEQYKIHSLKETEELANKISNIIKPGQVITLKGTLGAGKTYFTSCLINSLLIKQGIKNIDVVSPTFNILKEYETPQYSIYHFDLYRIKNKNELYQLDIENAFENGISIIEWPEIAYDIIYNIAIEIFIEITGENERIFHLSYPQS